MLVSRREGSGALLLAYFIGLSLIHVPGAVNFLGDAPGLVSRSETEIGFKLTLVGMAALLFGAFLARWMTAGGVVPSSRSPRGDWRYVGTILLVSGIVAYFFASPLAGIIPSLTSLLSPIGSLLIVGVWAYLYDTTVRRDRRRMLIVLAALPLLPLTTLATGGFLGNGIYWLISIFAFLFAITPNRKIFYLAAPFVTWLGLSLAVTYFADRTAIREAVWYEDLSYTERLNRIFKIGQDFEPYNLSSPSQMQAIDDRLNQNYFVGLAKERIDTGVTQLQWGATVPWWLPIPRTLWPEKPEVGGGGDVVANATGLVLSKRASFGAGQVLEFYFNFGWPGILLGFFALGYILLRLDRRLAAAFRGGDLRGVLVNGMPGLVLLQPGGNLLEILVGFVAAMIAARVTWIGLAVFAPSILSGLPKRKVLRSAPGLLSGHWG
jgi:hypothetical protein